MLIEKERELTTETILVLLKAYQEASNVKIPTMEEIYRSFRMIWPKCMYELLKKNEEQWNLYIDVNQDIEDYILQTWRVNSLEVPSLAKIRIVVNDMHLCYKNEKGVLYNAPVVSVW